MIGARLQDPILGIRVLSYQLGLETFRFTQLRKRGMYAHASMPLLVAALSGTIPVPVGTIGPECQVWELVIGPHYTNLLNISSKKSAQQHMNTCLARACTVTHLPHHSSETR